MAIKTSLMMVASLAIFAVACGAATANNMAKIGPNYHGTCGQQVGQKHPGLKGDAFKAEYSKCMNDTAAKKNYLTD